MVPPYHHTTKQSWLAENLNDEVESRTRTRNAHSNKDRETTHNRLVAGYNVENGDNPLYTSEMFMLRF